MMTRLLTLLAALFLAGALCAQDAQREIDYGSWENLASRAETALEEGDRSTAELVALRERIAEARTRFVEAESAGQGRIDTLNRQLDALGPAPAEGESEPAEIAERRAELELELANAEAPRRTATEAFNRAAGLVTEIDNAIRERDTRALLELGPSPLNPTSWPSAVTLLTETYSRVSATSKSWWSDPFQRSQARQTLPLTLALTVIGLIMFTNGRRWMQRATAAIQSSVGAVGRVSLGFLVSLGQVALPVIGITALVQALKVSGLMGPVGSSIAWTLPWVGLYIYGALWLGARLFPYNPEIPAFLDVGPQSRARARRLAATLGILVGLNALLQTLSQLQPDNDAGVAVLGFPLIVGIGVTLFTIGRHLRRASKKASEATGEQGLLARFVGLLARLLTLIGIAGVLLEAVGYHKLAFGIVGPTSLSLGLLGVLVTVHGPIRDTYGLLARKSPEEARDALLPVLVSFMVMLASLPLFALIWGMRSGQLSDVWTRFLEGVTLGDTRVSPSDLVTVLVVFAIGFGATRMIQSTLRTSVLPRTRLDVGGRNAITAGVGYVGIFLAAVIAITTAGINLSSLAIVAGALSVGIGFGLQNIVSNFVSGIILLIERPISEGDWIEVGGQMGHVRDISVRSTRMETFDRTDVIIPNADLVSGTVTNWTRGNLLGRVIVPVGVAYGTDTRKVERILREIAEACEYSTSNPPPNILFTGFGADSLDFEIRAFLHDIHYLVIARSEMNHEINRRFAEEGIEIPFAQRDVWLRNPEALRAGGGAEETS